MIKQRIKEAVEKAVRTVFGEIPLPQFEIETPRKGFFGDYATNIAFVLKKSLDLPPLEIAEKLVQELTKERSLFEKVEFVNPGFINFWVSTRYYLENLLKAIEEKDNYGQINLGKGKKVLVEFVSANPTGPLHIGHGRGAAYGDSLARVLEFTGYSVTREYYINDKGTQMDILGESVYLRAKELNGEKIDFPEDFYKGEYIYDIAKKILADHPNLLELERKEAIAICREIAIKTILEDIKSDLERFRVVYDSWYSEKSLYEKGKVDALINLLKQKGLVYEKEGALWFRSSDFGDEKDRVLIRSNGEYTYFAGDIAYHHEKFVDRGFDLAINLWGADHHGYVKRLKGALKALGLNSENLEVILIQMVNLIEGGELKSMSTRQGEFVELKELLDEVGVDATRYIFLSRSSDSPLDFDIDLAKKQSQENPVYYVQYAHARICSIFEKAKEQGLGQINWREVDFSLLSSEEEIALAKKIEEFKEVIESAGKFYAPYKLTYYLLDLAKQFHEFYTKHRVLSEDIPLTLARLGLCLGCKIVLKNGLNLLGVNSPEKM
ncbi:arginine--tRNA ligase [Thermodesulfobacterium hveragerdense]|uniref:arginine--tRNA ligase n=1 Tax=Thermodesulfobacterium hveragerdense TaxID=53424 RepID=UPI0003FC33D9|nr:arginine--tRNA ligase [Thermodesulfobacterium hveragerdense]